MLVGVISDTHGLLRPEGVAALKGSDVIIHAGDIGRVDIVEQLREIAPTFAVPGNNDTEEWAESVPLTQVVEVGELLFYVLRPFTQSSPLIVVREQGENRADAG